MVDDEQGQEAPPVSSEPRPASAQAGETAPDAGSPWKKIGAIAATIIAVVGAVTGVIQIVQAMNRNMSGVDTVTVTASVVEDSISEWAIPGGALADFPADASACGAQQLAWLDANAAPLERKLDISMRNTASEGATVVVDFIESQLDGGQEADAAVLMVCDPAGAPGAPRQFARVNTSGEPAFYQRPISEGEPPAPASRVTWNLAPGETGTVRLHVFSPEGAAGSLTVSVTSGSDQKQIAIEGSEFEVPPLLLGGEVALYATAEGFVCEQLVNSVRTPCTLEGVRGALERLGQ